MRLLIAWGVLLVGALVSAFVLPMVIDSWMATTTEVDGESSLKLGSTLAQSLGPVMKLFVQWLLPIALFFVGVKVTAEHLARRQK